MLDNMVKRDITFVHIDNEQKQILLDILGYKVNDKGYLVSKETKKLHVCPITKEKVKLEKASILPGSELVINTNPISLSEYISKYLE
jgi:hypothetical protein